MWWALLFFGIRDGTRHGDVDVNLEFLKFLVDEAKSSCDHRVGDLDSLKSENAELQFFHCPWCGVLQGLDLQEEDRCRGIDTVG